MFKWLKDAKRVPSLEREIEALRAERDRAITGHHEALKALSNAQAGEQASAAKIATLENKLREQNEADLLLCRFRS